MATGESADSWFAGCCVDAGGWELSPSADESVVSPREESLLEDDADSSVTSLPVSAGVRSIVELPDVLVGA